MVNDPLRYTVTAATPSVEKVPVLTAPDPVCPDDHDSRRWARQAPNSEDDDGEEAEFGESLFMNGGISPDESLDVDRTFSIINSEALLLSFAFREFDPSPNKEPRRAAFL